MNDPRSGEPDRDKDRDELGQSEIQRPSTSTSDNNIVLLSSDHNIIKGFWFSTFNNLFNISNY